MCEYVQSADLKSEISVSLYTYQKSGHELVHTVDVAGET